MKHANYNVDRLEYKGKPGGVVLGPLDPVFPSPSKIKFGYGYRYNGQEWQDELGLNVYAMDMRQYDPAIARWVVQDPVVHHNVSPYNAFDNNPVFWTDPSGADSQTLYDFNGNAHTVNDSDMVNLWKSSQANDNSIAEIFDYFGTSHISDGDFDGGGETDPPKKGSGALTAKYTNGKGEILVGNIKPHELNVLGFIEQTQIENNTIIWFSHGSPNAINGQMPADKFHEFLLSKSELYRKSFENKQSVAIKLISCNTGIEYDNGFALRLSRQNPYATIWAPTNEIVFGKTNGWTGATYHAYIGQPASETTLSKKEGVFNVYNNGTKVSR